MDCSFKFADMISESQAWHGALNRDIFESLQNLLRECDSIQLIVTCESGAKWN